MITALVVTIVVLVALLAAALRLGYVRCERGTGSWSNRYGDFDVETLELYFGGYYLELVWGWWAR